MGDSYAATYIYDDEMGQGLRYWDVYTQTWSEAWPGYVVRDEVYAALSRVDRDMLIEIVGRTPRGD